MKKRVFIGLVGVLLLALSTAVQAQSLNDLWKSSWGNCGGVPCLSISNATSSGPWTGNDTLNDLLKLSFTTCSGVPCMRVSIDGGGSTVPAPGSNTQVLFNDSGVIGADAGFTYVKGTDTATLGGLVVTTLKISGASSGTVTLAVPAAAGTNTLTLPAGTTDLSATGGTSQVLKQTSAGGALTVARLACADLSDASSGCSASGTSFANPTASVGGSAVNGSASTAMRSDGAPALAAVQTRRVCSLVIGADNGAVLVDADLGPQGQQCKVPAAGTVQEIVVNADAGTPSVIVRKKHCATFAAGVCTAWTSTDLLSSALAAAASNFDACSNTGGTTGLDGGTTCSATLQNGTLAVGDWIELKSGTAGGTAKRFSIDTIYTIN